LQRSHHVFRLHDIRRSAVACGGARSSSARWRQDAHRTVRPWKAKCTVEIRLKRMRSDEVTLAPSDQKSRQQSICHMAATIAPRGGGQRVIALSTSLSATPPNAAASSTLATNSEIRAERLGAKIVARKKPSAKSGATMIRRKAKADHA